MLDNTSTANVRPSSKLILFKTNIHSFFFFKVIFLVLRGQQLSLNPYIHTHRLSTEGIQEALVKGSNKISILSKLYIKLQIPGKLKGDKGRVIVTIMI